MLSGGDGGLSIGNIQMDQYKLLNKGKPYASRQEAKRFIDIIKNSCYGSGKDKVLAIHKDVEFQITESEAEEGFYIWYKLPEKHSL